MLFVFLLDQFIGFLLNNNYCQISDHIIYLFIVYACLYIFTYCTALFPYIDASVATPTVTQLVETAVGTVIISGAEYPTTTLTIVGNDFINAGAPQCRINNAIVVSATVISSTMATCDAILNFQEAGNFNVSFTNEGIYWSHATALVCMFCYCDRD